MIIVGKLNLFLDGRDRRRGVDCMMARGDIMISYPIG